MSDIDLKMKRSNCYKLLAACFYEPDRELFIQEEVCENLATLLADCGFEGAALAAQNMQKAVEKSNPEEMMVDYAYLFVGPFELAAPPYGSVYLEERRRLMGDSTMAVKKMYSAAGLSLEIKEAPDHIALELEFLHYLSLREVETADEGNDDQAESFALMGSEFMQRYLAPWMPAFCKKIRENTDNDFYVSLADCLEQFIASESANMIPLANDMETDHAERAAV